MAKILFWNCYRRALETQIAAACREHNVDIIILAEADRVDIVPLLKALNAEGGGTYTLPVQFSAKLKVVSRFPPDAIRPVKDAHDLSAHAVRPPVGREFLLIGVHLLSKTAAKPSDQLLESVRVAEFIRACELKEGHKRTMVIGDFNMNPFEEGMVAADALHAVMDRATAEAEYRTVRGAQRDFFYNPMWSRMGDGSAGPPGSYYYSDSQNVVYFWNMFDQVLIRPSLIPFLPHDGITVLTTAHQTSLLKRSGRPNERHYSDHLPLLATLEVENYHG